MAVHRAKREGEKTDSSLRRFRFQVTAETAESESGGKSMREKAGQTPQRFGQGWVG